MKEKVMENNQVILKGTVITYPTLHHETNGKKFYLFQLETKRLSETADLIPVIVSEKSSFFSKISIDDRICVTGQYRSYNKHTEGKGKLILTVYAREISFLSEDEKDESQVILEGVICKNVIYRKTPLGREIADIMLAVNRSYGKVDYIPCIAWGRDAYLAANLEVGDKINITGRIQSRAYEKKFSNGTKKTRVAYEVSIRDIECEQ